MIRLIRGFEDRTEHAFLPPDVAGLPFSIGGEAGDLGTGAGAAGTAVVGVAGAKDEVAAMVGRVGGGAGEFEMVDLAAIASGDAGGPDGVADVCRPIDSRIFASDSNLHPGRIGFRDLGRRR